MLSKKDKKLFSFSENPSFENAIEFPFPDEMIYSELKKMLILLSHQKSKLIIEEYLGNKSVSKYSNVEGIFDALRKDLEDNFADYTSEFAGEPIGFSYYI